MIEKLKALGESAKGVLLYILAPLGAILAYILYLRSKLSDLRDKIAISQAEKDFTNSMKNLDKIIEEAGDAEKSYKSARDDFNNGK